MDVNGILLDVVFVLFIHPVLRTPLKRGMLVGCGFWLIGKIGGKVRGCVVVWVIVCGIETNQYFRIIILHFIKGFTKWQKIRIKKRQL